MKYNLKSNLKKGFTLAEVLITLAIIGVVAAISIPSVISNTRQQEFKTGLRKTVSVLNSAITMNMALEGESPYDNANLFGYLMRHMSVIESTTHIHLKFATLSPWSSDYYNAAFYTTDGMRFEISRDNEQFTNLHLHESDVMPCTRGMSGDNIAGNIYTCGGCGSYGLNNNTDGTTKPPLHYCG